MAEPEAAGQLYPVSMRNHISEHIINIYGDHELSLDATIRKFRLVQTEGNYSLSAEYRQYIGRLSAVIPGEEKNELGTQ